MSLDLRWLFYLAPLALAILTHLALRQRHERRSLALLHEAKEAGLDQPVSLHPRIDPSICIGCGACVKACPEGDILGLVDSKAKLISPSECIGHGACRGACPVGAITLVFGTEQRGVELPHVRPDFQTNVPGLYIAGELGGMGLIRNAIEQGRQAMEEIGKRRRRDGASPIAGDVDVAIVGGGPAGISASLAAQMLGLRAVTIEQESLGGTVAHFPRDKLVMTQPAQLPGRGKMNFREIRKEDLLGFWQDVIDEADLKINYNERVETLSRTNDGFELQTSRGTVRASSVLLAIGRRGAPRRLDVPGEELSKVVYRLADPKQYRGKHVLVVGGGDSALEAAATLAEETDAVITLAYRGQAFQRAKPKNRDRVMAAVASQKITVLLRTEVVRIEPQAVQLSCAGSQSTLINDAVIICAGGILPTQFLRDAGIDIEVRRGT